MHHRETVDCNHSKAHNFKEGVGKMMQLGRVYVCVCGGGGDAAAQMDRTIFTPNSINHVNCQLSVWTF